MLLNRSRGGGGGNDSNAGETMDQVVEKMLKDDLAVRICFNPLNPHDASKHHFA